MYSGCHYDFAKATYELDFLQLLQDVRLVDVKDLSVVVEREITAVLAREGRSSSTVYPWVVRDELGRESVTLLVARIDLQDDQLAYVLAVVVVVAQTAALRIAGVEISGQAESRGYGVGAVVLARRSRG